MGGDCGGHLQFPGILRGGGVFGLGFEGFLESSSSAFGGFLRLWGFRV